MSDSIFNFGFSRPRRRIEPQMSDESGGDFGDQSHAPDQGTTDQRDPGADALKELARLIGQPDSLPGAGRPDQGHPPGGSLADVLRSASSPTASTPETFIRPPAREQAQSQDRSREDRSYDDQSREDRSADDRFRQQRRSFEGRSSSDRGAPARRESDFARSRVPVQPNHPETHHSETPADNFDFLQLPDRDDYAVAPQHPVPDEEDYRDRGRRESSLTGRRHPPYAPQHEDDADEYHEDEYEPDEEGEYQAGHDEPDDGEAGTRRRSTTRVVVAVLGLAVFGTAAAFGYRTIFKAAPSGATSTPIIRADNSPTKITPVAVDANAKPASGLFDDRSREQLVRREEEPVDVAASYGGSAADSSPPAIPATANPALPGDPKRVRTVPIRADQGEASSSDRTPSRSVPPPQAQSRPPSPPRQVAAAPASPQPQPPLPSPPRQVAAASPPPPPAGEGRAGSTSAQAAEIRGILRDSPPAREGRGGGAVVATAAEPAASRAIEAGGFVVQVSSQRSESEAQAAFRTLQTKYPALSGREPLIRRKDLGERGIFFAAQVGPFGVKSEADQLCETLKTAGGACFVQKN